MKKIIMVFIGIVLFLFVSRYAIVIMDNGYVNSLENDILNYTDVRNIDYVNKYDGHYLVKDNEYLYLFNSDFEEIINISLSKIYNNDKNYDIVYRNKTIMYMDNYKNKEGIIYKYYDIYTYEFIDEVKVEISDE